MLTGTNFPLILGGVGQGLDVVVLLVDGLLVEDLLYRALLMFKAVTIKIKNGYETSFKIAFKGVFINDVTQLGGGRRGFTLL